MGLPRRATQLPLTAISLGLQAWEHSRGVREFALRRGNEALQIAAMTPLGRLLPKQLLDDGADEEAARIAAGARSATDTTVEATRPARQQPPAASAPAPAPTPAPAPARRAEPPAAAKAVGAPGAVTDQVEQISDELDLAAPQSRDELPIPDFDNISIGSLRARLRSLSVEQLVVLREWEQAHANRLQVITTLDNRIAKLDADRQPATTAGTANDLGASGTDYPQEAVQAERAAESEGGTLRI